RYTTEIGTPVTIDLKQLTMDKDQDSLTAGITDKPTYGDIDDSKINSDGIIVYSPHDPSNSSSGPTLPAGGEDTFTYSVFDGKQSSNKATITINQTIPPPTINNAPIAYDIHGETEPDKSVEIKFNTSDQESDDLTASIVKEPSCGSQVINQDAGSLFYTAKSTPSLSDSACIGDQIKGWNDSFTYKVNDGKQDSKPATVTVRINQT